MPLNNRAHVDMHTLPVEERLKHPQNCQEAWYRLIATELKGKSVLDVGAAGGFGMKIYRDAGAACVDGIDLLPLDPSVSCGEIFEMPTNSYDYLTAMDVIEHVIYPHYFLIHLTRVSRQKIFFSTPNWNFSKCANIYHVREFTPNELMQFTRYYRCEYFIADAKWNIRRVDCFENDEMAPNFGVIITV